MRGSGVKKVKQWRKKVEGSKVLAVTLEEGSTRNQPRVAVVDHQRLVHVVAHLLLNLKVGQVKHQKIFRNLIYFLFTLLLISFCARKTSLPPSFYERVSVHLST